MSKTLTSLRVMPASVPTYANPNTIMADSLGINIESEARSIILFPIWLLLLVVTIFVTATTAMAAAPPVSGGYGWAPDKPSIAAEPPHWEELRESRAAPIVAIDSIELSAPIQLEGIATWNKHERPRKNGVTHKLTSGPRVDIDPYSSALQSTGKTSRAKNYGQVLEMSNGDVMWSSTVRVENSYRLRLHLTDVYLPEGAKLWVYGEDDEYVGPFGAELVDDEGRLYTPSVAGPSIDLAVLLPEDNPSAQFTIGHVVELVQLDKSGQPTPYKVESSDLSCLKDAECIDSGEFPVIDDAARAIAHIEFMKDGVSYICSGGLINDTVGDSWIPYFLTANHCISTQNEASSLEAYWDYKPAFCGGSAPSLGSLKRTSGATLLETGATGDFTLLRLNSVPSGRWFLGWNANSSAIEAGTILHRISHPGGDVQSYAQTRVDGGNNYCSLWPRSSSIYQSQILGGTTGGSSGSPVITSEGYVVGQLSGGCGDNPSNDCDYSTLVVDGSLNTYWSSVAQYINPQTSNPADLSVTILDAESGTYSAEELITVTAKIENIGGEQSEGYRIAFYASENSTITTNDYHLYYWEMDPLDPGANHHYNFDNKVHATIPDGKYYIGAIVTVSDGDPTNNSRYDSGQITILNSSPVTKPADLELTRVSAYTDTYAPGEQVDVSSIVTNIGGVTSTPYRISFYASPNSVITSSDYYLGSVDRPALDQQRTHDYTTTMRFPNSIPADLYYVGAIITVNDAHSDNNIAFDRVRVKIEQSDPVNIKLNPGLNGAWFDPNASGQGFLIEVLPDSKMVFLSWFTFDTVRPPLSYTATLGEPGHRWLTAQGDFSGGVAQLVIYKTEGGVFDKSSPAPSTEAYGSMTLEFASCQEGTITYSIPGIASTRVIKVGRIALDNVKLCESLNNSAQQVQSDRNNMEVE